MTARILATLYLLSLVVVTFVVSCSPTQVPDPSRVRSRPELAGQADWPADWPCVPVEESWPANPWFEGSGPLRITILAEPRASLDETAIRAVDAYLTGLLSEEVQIRQEPDFSCDESGCNVFNFLGALFTHPDSHVLVFSLAYDYGGVLGGALGVTIGDTYIVLDNSALKAMAEANEAPLPRQQEWTLLHELGHWLGLPSRACHLLARDTAHCTEANCSLRCWFPKAEWRARLHSDEPFRFGPLCEEEIRWLAALRKI